MRYKPKSIAALHIALGGLPVKMRVEADPDIGVSAKSVGEFRKVTAWPENLVIITPQEQHRESAVKVSKASGGEPGHDIIPELYPLKDEPVIDKPGKGAFYQTDLELMLRNRGIDTLFVCGVTTEVCVNTTVREANDRGFRCVVLSDCCASYFPQFHEAGLAMIKAQGGIFGSVAASKPLLTSLAAVN